MTLLINEIWLSERMQQNDKLYEENKRFYDLKKNKCVSELISRFTDEEMML